MRNIDPEQELGLHAIKLGLLSLALLLGAAFSVIGCGLAAKHWMSWVVQEARQ